MTRPLLLAALLLLAGCRHAPLAERLIGTQVSPDSSMALVVSTIDTATVYHFTIRGFGHYDQAAGYFICGTLGDGLTLHGVYSGEDVPNAHDYLWLSQGSDFYQVVAMSVNRSLVGDFVTISIPFQVVPPSPQYAFRVYRIDENYQKAGIMRSFDGVVNELQ